MADLNKFIVRKTFFNKNRTVKANFTIDDRYHLDRLGNLSIHNLTLNDAGNYTCVRINNDNLVVQVVVAGK